MSTTDNIILRDFYETQISDIADALHHMDDQRGEFELEYNLPKWLNLDSMINNINQVIALRGVEPAQIHLQIYAKILKILLTRRIREMRNRKHHYSIDDFRAITRYYEPFTPEEQQQLESLMDEYSRLTGLRCYINHNDKIVLANSNSRLASHVDVDPMPRPGWMGRGHINRSRDVAHIPEISENMKNIEMRIRDHPTDPTLSIMVPVNIADENIPRWYASVGAPNHIVFDRRQPNDIRWQARDHPHDKEKTVMVPSAVPYAKVQIWVDGQHGDSAIVVPKWRRQYTEWDQRITDPLRYRLYGGR